MPKFERNTKRTVSFVDVYVAQNPQWIHKVKVKDSTGQWAYYFVFVRPHAEKTFLTALKADKTINLEDFGLVVGSCYGEKPDHSVIEHLREKYGFIV